MRTATLAIAAVALFAAAAHAQVYPNPAAWNGYHRGWGYGYHHASTHAEGYLRGKADLHRGIGQREYMESLARINNEEARGRYFDNQLKGTETYFAKRQINREAQAAERGPRPTQQDLERYAKTRAPERLGEAQYNAGVGRLTWPAALSNEVFQTERSEIDRLVADRMFVATGEGSENHDQIRDQVETMRAKLKANITSLSPTEYLAAKKVPHQPGNTKAASTR
jgi:hypothetical protein